MTPIKKEIEAKRDLLEFLAEKVRCEYLSDLKNPELREKIRTTILKIEEEDFSLEEWSKAIFYITKKVHPFQNSSEAKKFLEQWDDAGKY